MGIEVNDREFQNVVRLLAPKRYEYFVKKIADANELWSLCKEGNWALTSDDDGTELVPVWPRERFAAACALGIWSSYVPKAIPLEEWLRAWIPGLIKDSRKVAVS